MPPVTRHNEQPKQPKQPMMRCAKEACLVIRRIRNHVAEHNWFAVLIDFLIVVAGIVIGTQVNNWNSDRIDRAKSVALRERLVSELRFNQRQYYQQWLYYLDAKRHGLAALNALHEKRAELGEPFLIDAYQATQMDLTPPRHFVFDGIVSSGLLELIGDERVQEMTNQYYLSLATDAPQLSEAPAYRNELRSVLPYEVQSAIRTHCGDRNVTIAGEVIGQSLPAACEVALPSDQVADAVSRLRTGGLEDPLTRYLSALDQKIGLLRGGAQNTALLDALQQRHH